MFFTFLCVLCGIAEASSPRVLIFLPPKGAMGSEFVQLMDELEEMDIGVVVVSESIGSYEFWEDSSEGAFSGALQDYYKWTITQTYEGLELEGYGAIIVGPGFAHTAWFGPSVSMARGYVKQALEQGIPVGGVSFGAAVVVSWGLLNGRSAAMPPYYQGVVIQGSNKAYFLSEFPDVTFENTSLFVDLTDDLTPIVTARYGAIRKFAREIANLIQDD